jgi:hypothetical protein
VDTADAAKGVQRGPDPDKERTPADTSDTVGLSSVDTLSGR